MRKRICGSIVLLVMLLVTVLGNAPMSTKADIRNFYQVNNEMKMVTNTAMGKVLRAGDSYKVEITIDDTGITEPVSASIEEVSVKFSGSYPDDREAYQATSFTHDKTNHCYVITYEKTIQDEVIGTWCVTGIELTDVNNDVYYSNFKSDEIKNYRFYVIDDTITSQLVLKNEHANLVIGGSYQINAFLIPSFEKAVGVVWRSDNESVATVDQSGTVTAKALGTAHIYAEYQGNSYLSSVFVIDKDMMDCNNVQQLNNKITILEDPLSGCELAKGDMYKLVVSIASEEMENITSAYCGLYHTDIYDSSTVRKTLKATRLSYDSINKCYTITFEGKADEVGADEISDFILKNDSNQWYGIAFKLDQMIHFTVIDQKSTEQPAGPADPAIDSNVTQPATEGTEAVTSATQETSESTNQTPQTGDSAQPVYILIAAMSTCIVIAIGTGVYRKKRRSIK